MKGKLEKLKIIAYKDPEFSSKSGEEFETLFNPEQLKEDYQIEYARSQADGTTGSDLKFKKILPPKYNFTFIFDGTGVAANTLAPFANISPFPSEPENVHEQIENFKKVTLGFDGETHSTRYLMINWGSFNYPCKLIDLKITYTLFKPDGTPLRAKADTVFQHFIEDKKRAAEEGKSSPDLTHIRTVKEGDNLPLMTHRIYGDPSLYLEIARVNQLKDYRKLAPGSKLYFPPVKEKIQ